MAGWVAQWHKHLACTAFLAAHIIFDDGVTAVEPAFVTKPFKNTLGCVTLFARPAFVFRQPLIDLINI